MRFGCELTRMRSTEMAGCICFFIMFFLWTSLKAQDLTLTASVSSNPVQTGELFRYELSVASTSSRSLPNVVLPDMSEFRIRSGPNQSTGFSYKNGSMSSTKTMSLDLVAMKVGEYEIPAVSVTHKGQTYTSNDITLRVVARATGNTSSAPSTSAKSADLFLTTSVSKKNVYVNEPISVAYKLYFKSQVRNPEHVKDPEMVGFWVEEKQITGDIPVAKEVVNGVQYSVAELKRLTIFPTKSGELTVSPMVLGIDVVDRRRRNPFDGFFDSPFGRSIRHELESEPIKFSVKPLPEADKPGSFSGLVGNMNFRAHLDKLSVVANEAISFKIFLSGNANMKSLEAIPADFPATFEVFKPKTTNKSNWHGATLQSSRELEYVLIPRTSGQFHIDPITFSYFDPSSGTYKEHRSAEYTVEVAPGDETATIAGGTVLSKAEVQLLGQDINFIKEGALELVPIGYKAYKTAWFWLTLVLPAICLGLAFGYRMHQEKLETNVGYARQRGAYREASKKLKGARQSLADQNYAQFYADVSGGLLGYVADKTNNSATGMTRDEVEALLRAEVDDELLVDEYVKILDAADFKRFAPGSTSESEAQSFYDGAENVLARLGKYL